MIKLPPTIRSRNATQKKNLANSIGEEEESFASAFARKFLPKYTERVMAYFTKQNIPVKPSDFNSSRNQSAVYNWGKKINSATAEDNLFPMTTEDDKRIYKNVDFWIGALDTLFTNDASTVSLYTQTANGLFKYVTNGRYGSDFRLLQSSKLGSVITPNMIWALKNVDYRNIFSVYILALYEYATSTKLRRSEEYYKYLGFIEAESNSVPIFRKELIQNSSFFRSMLIEFKKYYENVIKYLNLEDEIDYPALLIYLGNFPSDVTSETIFAGFDKNNIPHFIETFVGYTVGGDA